MKVIFIGSDRSIFEEGSAARTRMVEYGTIFDEIHIVIFVKNKFQINPKSKIQIAENVWVYGTNSWCRWFYPFDGARIARSIIENCKLNPPAGGENSRNDFIISGQDPFEAGLAALWAVEKTGAKLHIQIHTDFLSPFFKAQSLLNIIRVKIAEKVLPKADAIRVVSPRIKHSVNLRFGISESKIDILPIFAKRKDLLGILPFDYKVAHPDWTFTILSIGRLESEKNFEAAIRALRIVCQKYPHTGLAIIGGGRRKNALKALSHSLGLDKNVVFLGKKDDIYPYFKNADIYLQTSNYEGFGLAATEAAYAGLPLILTDVGAAGWIFRDGENSKICSVGDEGCLSQSIIHMIENQNGLREKLRNSLLTDFGKELIQSKAEYLASYKDSIEKVFTN